MHYFCRPRLQPFSSLLTILQPLWSLWYSLNKLGKLPPQGLCTCFSHCLEDSSHRYLHSSFSPFDLHLGVSVSLPWPQILFSTTVTFFLFLCLFFFKALITLTFCMFYLHIYCPLHQKHVCWESRKDRTTFQRDKKDITGKSSKCPLGPFPSSRYTAICFLIFKI